MSKDMTRTRELSAQEIASVSGAVSLTTPLTKSYMTVRELVEWKHKYVNTLLPADAYDGPPVIGVHETGGPGMGNPRSMP